MSNASQLDTQPMLASVFAGPLALMTQSPPSGVPVAASWPLTVRCEVLPDVVTAR